jgi:hypothetical protein
VNLDTIDVYLEPLYDEIIELWKGIEAIQFLNDGDSMKFTLRVLLLFSIHDLPTFWRTN